MTYYGASYLPPTSKSATFDSTSFNRGSEALTYETALNNFLSYPNAQGTEDLKITNISRLTTLTNNLVIDGSGNYIQFPDLSQQTTAFIEANYAQLNTDNVFQAPYKQTFQGSNNSTGVNCPFQITNVDNGEQMSMYVDKNANVDMTLYSGQTNGGLTVRTATNSFTINPISTNIAGFINPIDLATNAISNTSSIGFNNGTYTSSITQSGVNLNIVSTSSGVVSINPAGSTQVGNLTALGSYTSTNGNVTLTNGNLTLTNGTMNGQAISSDTSITATTSVNGNTLTATTGITTTNGDIFVGGEATFAKNSNLTGTSLSTTGLYLGRNIDGNNEFDIIAINPTSTNALSIYGTQNGTIDTTTIPVLKIQNNLAYMNNNLLATSNQLATYYSTALNTSTSYYINEGSFQYNISYSSSGQKIFTPTGTNISIVPNVNYPTNTLTITFTTPLSITGSISYPAIYVYMYLYDSYVYSWSGVLTSTTLVLTYSGASTIPSSQFVFNPQSFGYSPI